MNTIKMMPMGRTHRTNMPTTGFSISRWHDEDSIIDSYTFSTDAPHPNGSTRRVKGFFADEDGNLWRYNIWDRYGPGERARNPRAFVWSSDFVQSVFNRHEPEAAERKSARRVIAHMLNTVDRFNCDSIETHMRDVKYNLHAGCSTCPCSPGFNLPKHVARVLGPRADISIGLMYPVNPPNVGGEIAAMRAAMDEQEAETGTRPGVMVRDDGKEIVLVGF